MVLPNMLFGATVRSQIPRGRIRKITFGPGIAWDEFVIVSAKDIPGKNCIALIGDDQPCLANEFVNHPEEPILLLAHPDRHLLPKAVEAVSIEYEPLPAIFTIEESERRSEIVWGEDNIFKTYLIEKGDVDGVWEKADYIVEGEYTTGAQEQLYIENNGMIAAFDAARGNHGMGLAAVPLLHSQGADDSVRFARGKSSRGADGDRRSFRREGRISVDDRRSCCAAGDQVRKTREDYL